MQAVSARFLAALRDVHAVSLAARVYPPGMAAPGYLNVSILGGELTVDVDAEVRRQASLDIAFALGDPVKDDLIALLPFGGYCQLERGIRFADGSTERVLLGVFRIENVTWPEVQGQASLTLADRMAQVNDEALQVPYTASGKKPSNAIVELVQAVFGATITYDVRTTPATEPTLADTVYDEDRGAAIRDLAAGVGAIVFFDAAGNFVLTPRPSGTGTPVWTLDTGPQGVLISSSESLDRSNVRNGVSVRAQADVTTAPIYSLKTDDDPASPTRWGGPFGKVPLIVTSQSIQSQAAADSVAATLLSLRLGLSRSLELHGVPNPALEGGDLIEIVHADGRSETALVNGFSLGLDPTSDLTVWTRTNWRPAFVGSSRKAALVRSMQGVEA
jgi:hypothetical protein